MSFLNSVIGHRVALIILATLALGVRSVEAADQGDPDRGRGLFRACSACHSLTPGRHMTGPSLAHIWGKKSGTVEGFRRYSDALKKADVTWDRDTLDKWIKSPKEFIPKNRMTFRGMPNRQQRRDLIAFLRQVSEENDAADKRPGSVPGRAVGQGRMVDLSSLDANNRVTKISHCDDTYTVTVENGDSYPFWEFNLRFKTDGSDLGPAPGHPVIIPASMSGDRAFVIFADPSEISPFINKSC